MKNKHPIPPQQEDETARFLRAWMRVRQIVQAANFNRFHREGLSATQFMTLNALPAEGATLSELARQLNLSAATLSETVSSLEERGLLGRERHATDARKVTIRATQEGKEMQNAASQEFHRFMADLFGGLSRNRQQGLLSGLEEMVRLSEYASPETSATRRGDAAPRAKRSSPRSPRP